jgi:hypothetical protein
MVERREDLSRAVTILDAGRVNYDQQQQPECVNQDMSSRTYALTSGAEIPVPPPPFSRQTTAELAELRKLWTDRTPAGEWRTWVIPSSIAFLAEPSTGFNLYGADQAAVCKPAGVI